MKLPARLEYIFSLCDKSDHTVDVGTDHGKLAVALVLSGTANKVTASDVNEKPLSKARKLVEEAGVSDKVSVVLTNGLNGLEDENPDQIVIAGMGGELIRDILSAAPWIKNNQIRLILQPMTNIAELRRYLFSEGFEIKLDGAVSEDKKAYDVIVAVYDGIVRESTFLKCELGEINGKTSAERELLLKKRFAAEKRLIGAKKNNSDEELLLSEMIDYINNCLEDE